MADKLIVGTPVTVRQDDKIYKGSYTVICTTPDNNTIEVTDLGIFTRNDDLWRNEDGTCLRFTFGMCKERKTPAYFQLLGIDIGMAVMIYDDQEKFIRNDCVTALRMSDGNGCITIGDVEYKYKYACTFDRFQQWTVGSITYNMAFG